PIGFHYETDYPIIVGLDEALAAHLSVFGGTQSHKSVTTSSIINVLVRQRNGLLFIGHKTTEPPPLGPATAGTAIRGAPLALAPLKEVEPSRGLNLLAALGVHREAWRLAIDFGRAADLNVLGEDRGQDYYGSAVETMLEITLPGCRDFIELLAR